MKRSIGAPLIIAIGVCWVAAGPGAVPAARADTSTVSASDLQVRAVGTAPGASGLAVSLDPGASATGSFVVSNLSSDLRLTVHLVSVDEPGPGSAAAQTSTTASSSGTASWMTLSDVVETLEPGASAPVSVKIAVPANAIPGESVADVVVQVDQAVRDADAAPVSGNPSASMPVSVTVNGAATAQVNIASVRAVDTHGTSYLEIAFQNVGATPELMSGRVRVLGTRPATYAVRVNATPLARTTVRVPWAKPAGSDAVKLAVDTDDAQGDEAAWNGSVGGVPPPVTTPGSVATVSAAAATGAHHGPPWVVVFVLLAFALAAVWLGYEMVRAHARRRVERVRASVASIVSPAPVAGVPTAMPAPGSVVVAEAQIGAIATQLGALVDALDRLTRRLDASPAPTPILAAVASPSASPPAAPPLPRVAPVAPIAPVTRGVDDDPGYPYDWPTEAQLERFVEQRRAAGRDLL